VIVPIPIDPDSGLSLADEGPGDRQRFAGIFHAAWNLLQAADRERIVDWWHAGFAGEPSPQIHLMADYELPAAAESFGHRLFFNAGVADLMPEAILSSLIGHELAHVLHYATPGSAANQFPPNYNAKEAEADATADAWGFSMADLRAWANANAQAIIGQTGSPNVGW
jgi:hypothetical protein